MITLEQLNALIAKRDLEVYGSTEKRIAHHKAFFALANRQQRGEEVTLQEVERLNVQFILPLN